jgi:arginine deiminase
MKNRTFLCAFSYLAAPNPNEPAMHVRSEIATLKKVIIHQPNFGIEKVKPEDAEELLYDDIVYFPRMLEEHRIFTDSLRSFLGEEHVYEIEDLLIQTLEDSATRADLMADLVELEGISSGFVDELDSLNAEILGKVLIAGSRASHVEEKLNPLPNLIFTRDLGVAINDHFVICSAATQARIRESLLSSHIFRAHPLFKEKASDGKVIDLYQAFKGKGIVNSLEGGDMMIINEDHVFIGCSERTNEEAIRFLAKILLDKGIVRFVSQVKIPPKRYCMHLDTIFTVVDHSACVGFKPLVFDPNDDVKVHRYNGSIDNVETFDSIGSLIRDIYPDIAFIPCGGGISPFQEREQWTDGSNLFALKAGVFYGYERNYHTSETVGKYGYEVESALLLNDELANSPGRAAQIENHLITLPSGELSRARGGSHCMTLPIDRT